MAMSIVFMHVLGDAISPLLVGFLLDVFDKNYHLTMLMLVSWLTFSCLHWLYAWRYVENLLLQASRNDISAAKLTNRKLGWDDEDDDGHTPLLSAAYRGEESISSDRGLHGSNGSGLGLSRGDGGQPDHSNRDLRDSGEFSPMLTPVFNHSTGERSAPIGVRMKLRTPSREQAAAAASNGADDDDKATGSGRTGSVYSFKLDA